jgi:hypothetical protein
MLDSLGQASTCPIRKPEAYATLMLAIDGRRSRGRNCDVVHALLGE